MEGYRVVRMDEVAGEADIAYARRIGHSLLEILAQAQHLLLQTPLAQQDQE